MSELCDYMDCPNPAVWSLHVDGGVFVLCGGHKAEAGDVGTGFWEKIEQPVGAAVAEGLAGWDLMLGDDRPDAV